MKLAHTFSLLLLLNSLRLFAIEDNPYRVSIDLTAIQDDKLVVEVILPSVKDSAGTWVFTRVAPGMYSDDNFGRFVENLQVFDVLGNSINTIQKDLNAWTISNLNKAHKLRYQIRDSWDEGRGSSYIFQPGGTGFEQGQYFVLNHHGLIGYLQNYKNHPFEITYIRKKEHYGATALALRESQLLEEAARDTYFADTYFELADNPILYSEPDTVSFTVGGGEVQIAVCSNSRAQEAKMLSQSIANITSAVTDLFPEVPFDRYAFLFFLTSPSDPVFRQGGYSLGALEHHNSSLYYMLDYDFYQDSAAFVKDVLEVIVHEFLHIITPLNLHSELIADFDFYQPRMSQHLWLYEGLTEYFANKVIATHSLLPFQSYLDAIRNKIIRASRYKDRSFTEMSASILDKKYARAYGNVYEKGALIGLALDITLIESSKGEMDLVSLVQKLSAKYGEEKPFKEEDLFNDIVELSNPKIRDFIDTYIIADTPLPMESILAKAGIIYKKKAEIEAWNWGAKMKATLIRDNGSQEFYLDVKPGKGSLFGDRPFRLHEINGEAININNVDQIKVKSDKEMTFLISRNANKEALTLRPVSFTAKRRHYISLDKTAVSEARALFEKLHRKTFAEALAEIEGGV